MQAVRLDIYNAVGQLCFSTPLEKKAILISIDLSDLKPGIYFINLRKVAGNIAVKKFVKI